MTNGERAIKAQKNILGARLVTTESVLIEALNFLCNHGPLLRKIVSSFVRDVLENVEFEVLSNTETTLLDGLELYESRPDKGYSLTDCISMNVCREIGIDQILTSDKHFTREGFAVLL